MYLYLCSLTLYIAFCVYETIEQLSITLADNHDIISVKMFEQDVDRVERQAELDRRNIVPHADFTASPRYVKLYLHNV